MTDPTFRIAPQTYRDILNAIANKQPEHGGILGCSREGVIDTFYYDESPISSTARSYVPNGKALSEIVNTEWRKNAVRFIGLIHSHWMNGDLSEQDLAFARELIAASALKFLLMGVCVLDHSCAPTQILWYRVTETDAHPISII